MTKTIDYFFLLFSALNVGPGTALRPTIAAQIQLEGVLFYVNTMLHQVFVPLRVKETVSQCLTFWHRSFTFKF
jgi:hypothetical protein